MRRALRALLGGVVVMAVAALAGCVSTPQATHERDAEAKRFMPVPGEATIYVYRPDFPTFNHDDPTIYVDGRLIGMALAGSFFRFAVRPGPRVLHGYANDGGTLKFEARAGELHFVSLTVTAGQSHYVPVGAETGKRDTIRCCELMENWAPGQRPLLR